jgi:hypothetical protein
VPAPVTALEFADHAAALRWCDTELPNFVPVLQLGLEHRACEPSWKLAVALWNYWLHRKPWTIWVRSQQLALVAAEKTGDLDAEGCVSVDLAEAHRRMGGFVQSIRLDLRALDLLGGWGARVRGLVAGGGGSWLLGRVAPGTPARRHRRHRRWPPRPRRRRPPPTP